MPIEKWSALLVALSALAGAAGVAEAAYAAHGSANPLLEVSSRFLVLHAAAVIAISSVAQSAPFRSKAMLSAASLLLLGTVLFCSDLSKHALEGDRLFPMAAPTGGSAMILGWLGTAIAALWRVIRPIP